MIRTLDTNTREQNTNERNTHEALLPPTQSYPWHSAPLDPEKLRQYLADCMARGIGYKLGAKADDLAGEPPDYAHIDCSGWVRAAIAVASGGQTILPDGSVNQNDWCAAQGLKRSTFAACRLQDGLTRMAFIRPSLRHAIGHVYLARNGRTLESWGGQPPGDDSCAVCRDDRCVCTGGALMKWQNLKLQNVVKAWSRQEKPLLEEMAPANGVSLLGALTETALPGDGLPGGSRTYRRMLADPQVKACVSTKKFAALSQEWAVHAASESPEDEQIAAFVRFALSAMRGSVLDTLYDVLDALAFGVSLIEINYRLIETGPYAGMVGLASLKSKDPGGFTFETDAFANVVALRGMDGAAYPPDKFLRYAWLPLYESPLGQSDLYAAYKPWFVKQQLLKWWAKYLEKFGMPTVTGTYDPNRGYGPDQQRELLAIVAQVHNESAVVLPSDMHLGLLETARAQSAGFSEAIEYLDRAIAKSILGQTLTTDSTAKGASYALGAVHQDILGLYVAKLQRDLTETVIGAQLLAPLVAYNFGPNAACPAFTLGTPDAGQLQTTGKLIADLVAGNVIAPTEPWIRGYLGLPAA